MQPNKPDRPNRPNEQDRLADFFSILLTAMGMTSRSGVVHRTLVDLNIRRAQAVSGICLSPSHRRASMKKIMLSLIALMCLAGFSSLSFAEDMGKMKGEMKGEMKGKMKAKKSKMKAKHNEMKGEMKEIKDETKGEMKGATGK